MFVGGLQGLVLSPDAGYSRYAANTHLLIFLFFWKFCNYMELSKLGFVSSLSRKDERIAKSAFPQGRRVSLPALFSHYILGVGKGICEYPLVICR